MQVSNAGKELIKKHEKRRKEVYDDGYGNLTVGYGHKVLPEDDLVEGQEISDERIDDFFTSDIAKVEKYVNTLPKISKLSQNQFDAISSLVFNVGQEPVVDKNNDLYKALNKDVFVKDEIVVGFTYTMGGESALVKRRNDELNMFFRTEGTVYITMNKGDSLIQVPVSAQLIVQGSNVSIRDFCDTTEGHLLSKVNTGDKITAINRVLVNGKPWFYIKNKGWISGDYVQGWVKDYNDNNRWWYVKKGYQCPTSVWEQIDGKYYCFGKDGYLFVECYIKSEVENKYYWVDDDGVWLTEWNTDVPEAGYRVVQNYKTENAYRG